MSRYVEITKDGNNYTVNPNASPSSGNEYNFYYWLEDGESNGYYTMTENPSVSDNVFAESDSGGNPDSASEYVLKAIGEGTITIEVNLEDIVLLRETYGDVAFVKRN